MDNTEDFFKNYRGKYSQYWIERWGLIPELPTSFDNANSMYELMAWVQRAFKNLLDDFQQIESEFEDFKNALVDLLEYLIPELIRRYSNSSEFRTLFISLLEDILAGEERNWVKDLLKELIEIDMREWIEDYLKELNSVVINELFEETTAQVNGMTLNVKYTPTGVEPLLGDGTDETVKMQAIFDYCKVNNIKKVLFPKGTYLFGGRINIDAWDMEIEGVGIRATNFQKINAGFMFDVDLSAGGGGWRHISFKNISFLGDNNKLGSGAKLHFVQQGLFENCDFSNLNKGVVLTGNSHYIKLLKCRFVSVLSAIHNPNSLDNDYIAGNSNNNIIDQCFFTYCDKPVFQGDGAEWSIRDTDFEGYNGTIELGGSNKFDNVRIERNIDNAVWLKLNGDGNEGTISLHGTGNATENWRVKVYGRFNRLKISAGYNVQAILDLGGNNHFEVIQSKPSDVYINYPILYMVRKDSSFIINNVETMYKSRAKAYSNNFITTIGNSSGRGTDTIKEEVSNEDEFIMSIPAFYTYGVASIDRTIPRWVNFAVDIFVEDALERELTEDAVNILGAGVSEFSQFKSKTWYRAIQMVFTNSTENITARVMKSEAMGSKRVVFANAQLSVDVPPADLPFNTLTLTKSIS